jgi:two-component system, chemotaxis family, protein-glutamate methylesterase/glutaminase
MPHRDIVVVGASAGGVEALSRLMAGLPADFPAAIFVSVHFPASSMSMLPRILNRAGPLEAVHPHDRDVIEPGKIYVAPPDHHLLVFSGRVRVVRGPTENGNRPAIDPMFRSASVAYGPRVLGVVLTGNLDDGTAGLHAIKRRGGATIAQDPAEAMFPSMPTNAIDYGVVDHIATLDDIPSLLVRLTSRAVELPSEAPVPDDAASENEFARYGLDAIGNGETHPGTPSSYSCPDCGGVLWEIRDGDMVRYRCRIGHGWTSDGLVFQQTQMIDDALAMALRSLEESANLSEQMAKRARRRGNDVIALRFEENQRAAEQRAAVIRNVLIGGRRVHVDAEPESVTAHLAEPTTSTRRK